ncbi:MAG: hypothetical protein ACPG4N_08155, partial [Gammaproteobacteria bacterium]
MNLLKLIFLSILSLILFGCGGETTVKRASQVAAPISKVDFEGGSILVSQETLFRDGEKAYSYGGEDANFLAGVQSYVNQHLRGWKVVASGEAMVTFHCTRMREGMTNCSDMNHECTVSMGDSERKFTRAFESGACMEGGNAKAYRTEARNHGVEAGKPLIEALSQFSQLKAAAAEEALAKALSQPGMDKLKAVIAQFPNTEEAERAREELEARQESARKAEQARLAEAAREERLYGESRRQYQALAARYKTAMLADDRKKACGKLSLQSPPSLPRVRRVGEFPKQPAFEQRINENAKRFGKHVQCVSEFLQNADYDQYAVQIEQDAQTEPALWQAANFKAGQQERIKVTSLDSMLDAEDAYMRDLQTRFEKNQKQFESEWKRQVQDEQQFARREAERRAEAAEKRRIAQEKKKCLMGLASRGALTMYSDGFCESQAKKGISGYDAARLGSAGASVGSSRSSLPSYMTNPYEMPKFDLAGTIANAREAARSNNPSILWDESGNIRTQAAPGVNRLDGYRRDSVRPRSTAPSQSTSSSSLQASPSSPSVTTTSTSHRERASQAVSAAKSSASNSSSTGKASATKRSGSNGINITGGQALSFAKKQPGVAKAKQSAAIEEKPETRLQEYERKHGCWDGLTHNRRSCLVVEKTNIKQSGQFFVTYKNACDRRLYVKSCIERQDGTNACGAFGIQGGGTNSWDAYEATRNHEARAIGSTKASSDWVCSDLVDDWNSFDD